MVVIHAVQVFHMQRRACGKSKGLEPFAEQLRIHFTQFWLGEVHLPDQVGAVGDIEREGSEILVAHWGAGMESPVHGHAPGLLHEEILHGKIYVHTYRPTFAHTPAGVPIARPVKSTMFTGHQILVSKFNPPSPHGQRIGLIHNFTVIEPSASLHFVPEHTRDGRDNKVHVERFGEIFTVSATQLEQVGKDEAVNCPVGTVFLIRSKNVEAYGDHWMVIAGPKILKDHGLRPMDWSIHAPEMSSMLDDYKPSEMGLIALRLKHAAAEEFLQFHGLRAENGRLVGPEV